MRVKSPTVIEIDVVGCIYIYIYDIYIYIYDV